MENRVIGEELLDRADDLTAATNLRDLRRINRWFGGHSIVRSLVGRCYGPDDAFHVLDVGAASGDMGRAIRQKFRRARVTSCDLQLRNLAQAPDPKLAADAFALPFRDGAFDLVMSSLFLHHFEDADAARLLAEMRRVSRRTVLAIDLQRHWVAHRFLPATRRLFGWHPVTLHDGPVSVAAAFRKPELRNLAQKAGLEGAIIRSHLPWFRLSMLYSA